MDMGSPTLHKRLPSLRIQARSLGYSAVLANRAGSQSSHKLRPRSVFRAKRLPGEPTILLIPSIKIRTISIIQGRTVSSEGEMRLRSAGYGHPNGILRADWHPRPCPFSTLQAIVGALSLMIIPILSPPLAGLVHKFFITGSMSLNRVASHDRHRRNR
jgi:hypothetical protein